MAGPLQQHVQRSHCKKIATAVMVPMAEGVQAWRENRHTYCTYRCVLPMLVCARARFNEQHLHSSFVIRYRSAGKNTLRALIARCMLHPATTSIDRFGREKSIGFIWGNLLKVGCSTANCCGVSPPCSAADAAIGHLVQWGATQPSSELLVDAGREVLVLRGWSCRPEKADASG